MTTQSDDFRDIEAVLAGDHDAFRTLVERYSPSLFRLIGNLLADQREAEDVAQETFVDAYRNLASFDPAKGRFSTWLLSIARNRALNVLKKRRPVLVDSDPAQSRNPGPERVASDAEWCQELDQALDELPVEQRTVFILCEFHELPHEEVAMIEQVPAGTIKSRLSRAKEKLRSRLRRVTELS